MCISILLLGLASMTHYSRIIIIIIKYITLTTVLLAPAIHFPILFHRYNVHALL